MRTYLNKSLSLLLCAALLVALAGCSSKPQQEQQSALTETESAAPNSEEAASTSQLIDDFAEVWATKWNELADDVVMSEQMGRAFLADLDSDGADELVFLYDDYLRYQGIVYRLGDSIEELGSFSVSNPSPELEFSIYQNGQGTVLYHKAVITHAGEDGNRNGRKLYSPGGRRSGAGRIVLHQRQRHRKLPRRNAGRRQRADPRGL